jgi:hypothetical protein
LRRARNFTAHLHEDFGSRKLREADIARICGASTGGRVGVDIATKLIGQQLSCIEARTALNVEAEMTALKQELQQLRDQVAKSTALKVAMFGAQSRQSDLVAVEKWPAHHCRGRPTGHREPCRYQCWRRPALQEGALLFFEVLP